MFSSQDVVCLLRRREDLVLPPSLPKNTMRPIFCCVAFAAIWAVSCVVIGSPLFVHVVQVLVVAKLVAKLAVALIPEVNKLGSAIWPFYVDRVLLVRCRAHERLV